MATTASVTIKEKKSLIKKKLQKSNVLTKTEKGNKARIINKRWMTTIVPAVIIVLEVILMCRMYSILKTTEAKM
jgi:hypothetical protein